MGASWDIVWPLFMLIFGLFLLVGGAERFVEASARIARKLGVSDLVIGLTLTAVGTSLPELATSLAAVLDNAPGIVIGNIVGSNIANIGLIMGIAACIRSFEASRPVYERDGVLMVLSAFLLYWFAHDLVISRIESMVFLLFFGVYSLFLIETKEDRVPTANFRHLLNYLFRFEYLVTIRSFVRSESNTKSERKFWALFKEGLLKDVFLTIISLVLLVGGARYTVDGAVALADILGIPRNLIALSVIAIGTSLPELAVSVSAAFKGYGDIILGNIVGSNIANILLILGVSGLVSPLAISELSLTRTMPVMVFFSILLMYFLHKGVRVRRLQGVVALVLYAAFMVYAFANGVA